MAMATALVTGGSVLAIDITKDDQIVAVVERIAALPRSI
jgi:hypothetical protein